jgi:hypothetical protein
MASACISVSNRLLQKWLVTPAKAGVQELKSAVSSTFWIPAFAGMTKLDVLVRFSAAYEWASVRNWTAPTGCD